MRRAWLALGIALMVAGCSGSGGTAAQCDKQYWDPAESIGLCIPQKWGVVDRETLRQRGVPDDTIVAFQAEDAVSGHFPTVTVTKEILEQGATAEAYSEASVRSVTVLPGYALIESTPVTVAGEAVRLHVFTAQPIADEPVRRFYQVGIARQNMGYAVTATAPVSVSDSLEQELFLILQSVTFSSEEEAEA